MHFDLSDALCCISESLLNHDLNFPGNPSTSLAPLLNCSKCVCAAAGERTEIWIMTWREIVLAVWKVSFKALWLAAANEAALFWSDLREQNSVQGQEYSGAVGLVE